MPRSRSSSSGRSAPARPTTQAPSRPAPQQTRPMSTAPTQQHPQQAHPPQAAQQSGGSGLFGQMASTAAGVAVGSSIGHAIGGFFGGGSNSSQAPAPEQQSYQQPADSYAQPGQAMDSSWYSTNAQQQQQRSMADERCAMDARNFTKCLDDNQGNMQSCLWHLEQLKACQAAARNY